MHSVRTHEDSFSELIVYLYVHGYEGDICAILLLLNEHAAYKRRGPRAEVIIVTFKIDKIDKDG